MEGRLRFSDGEEFDVTGPLRLEKRYDGWYVVGNNILHPVKDEQEGLRYIHNATDVSEN